MTIAHYIESISQRYELGNATEHTFRSDLQQLIESLVPDIRATNEPKRQACGAPDYILMRKDIPIGFIEAKDLADKDLEGVKQTGNKEQFDRYKAALNNIIFTDYVHFLFYQDGELLSRIAIGEIGSKSIKPLPENFANFENLLNDFCLHLGQTINNPKELARMMAAKARLLAQIIEKALLSDEDNKEDSTLKDQLNAFKNILIHDIKPKAFADVYAQTIVYGMFAARLHDSTLSTFSRQKAYELIPKSNPFLKKLFGYIAGLEVDDRIRWIVDSLIEVFLHCDIAQILQNYGKATQVEDPIIHFYETFLSEYDPNLRKSRGVWYTPAPVVNFMVRAVDDILKTEFDLSKGLADSSKIKIRVEQQGKKIEQEVHKVQILDPATGTGTFLAQVVKHIHKNLEGQQGIWSSYVENHLLPRLNGFELLMASYAMAHLQLDLLLKQTGYQPTNSHRLKIYLTNSLEESHPDTSTLFANWLSNEANEANRIKRDIPVMCIIGNPPYSGESQNKGEWIQNLMADYKKNLNEKNIQPLSDDYIKFIRLGQHFIDKNGSGILAYISNNSFLDGTIHRQMRKSLLQSFDKIYIVNLHGNSRKKETSLDGSPDQNVFDIMQGVSITIFVKTGKKKSDELGQVFHFDLFGKRELKYNFLYENSLKTVNYKELPNIAPNYFFTPKNFDEQDNYDKGFAIDELFLLNGTGIVSKRDAIAFQNDKNTMVTIIRDIQEMDTQEIKRKYQQVRWDSRDGKVEYCKQNVMQFGVKDVFFVKCNYRPFDEKWTYYTGVSKGFIGWPVKQVMQHFLNGQNWGLTLCKQFKTGDNYLHAFISNKIIESSYVSNRTSEITSVFPLYLYPEKPKTKLLSAEKKAQKIRDIEMQLKNAKAHYKQIRDFFNKTVLPFYQNINNPQDTHSKLFEENRSIFEEAKTNVENLEQQLKQLNEPTELLLLDEQEQARKPNLNTEIVGQIAKNIALTFSTEKQTDENTFAPIDILDYIYAILYSPSYRTRYKEFLKVDFPRVPYPKDVTTFWQFVKLGGQIRQIHLLESPILEKPFTDYPIDGNNYVKKLQYEKGKVYINDSQYFENVPQIAWEFFIGGYQPAQKWLKDRKDRQLSSEDILQYQKIIVALTETDKLMREIENLEMVAKKAL